MARSYGAAVGFIWRRLLLDAVTTVRLGGAVLVLGSVWPISDGLRENGPTRGGDAAFGLFVLAVGAVLSALGWWAARRLRRRLRPGSGEG